MSETTNDDIMEHSDSSLTGSDADSESSSESTVVSVDITSDKLTPSSPQLPSYPPNDNPDKPPEEHANAVNPSARDDTEGDKLRHSELDRLRMVFQDKGTHDSETSSDCDKSISRYDFSDAESVSSTDLEENPRPKLLSDYTLDYLHSVPKRDICDRDYMGTKVFSANRTLKLKDRRKTLGKRREPYNLQPDTKLKKSTYLTYIKSDDSSEDNKKLDIRHSNNSSKNILVCKNCPHETFLLGGSNKNEILKPVTSKTKITDEGERTPISAADLRKYRMPTRIPMPKWRRDMEGIFKAADDQFNSLDAEISFFQEEMNDLETETYDKGHTLEVIEESSFETISKDDDSEETLPNDDDRGSFGNSQADEDMQEDTSDISLNRSEYTVELIEEALKEVSRQTQLEPIEEEQPFMIENRTLRNFVNTGMCEERKQETETSLIDSEEQTFSDEQEEDSDSEENVEPSTGDHKNEPTKEPETPSHELMRVSLAKAALMKYAAQMKHPESESKNNPGTVRNVNRDDCLPSGAKLVDRNFQDFSDTDSDITVANNRFDVSLTDMCLTKSPSDTVNAVISCSQISTETNKTDEEIVRSENNTEVLNNMIKHIPLEQLSLDEQCVVANISSQQYTVYIKLKNKDKEGSSEDHSPAAEILQLPLLEEPPKRMLTYVTCTDPKGCYEERASTQIKRPKIGKEAPKVDTRETRNYRLNPTYREKLAQPRIKKTKPRANIIRSNKQRIKTDFPVLHEKNYIQNMTIEDDSIYEREVKRGLNMKVQEGRLNKRGSVPLHLRNNISTKSDSSPKLLVGNSPSPTHKFASLKSWLAMRQKLAFLGNNSPVQAMPANKQFQKNPDRRRVGPNNPFPLQTPASGQNRKRSRLIPKTYFEKAVRETRSSLLRRSKEKSNGHDSSHHKCGTPNKDGPTRKQNKKVDNPRTLHTNLLDQSQCEKSKVPKEKPKEKPKARISRLSPGFNRQCLDFIRPTAWQINDSSKFAFFCAPSYDTEKLPNKSKYQQKTGSFMKSSEPPRTNEITRPKKVDVCDSPQRMTTTKESRKEKLIESRKKVKEYLDKHGDINVYKSPVLKRRTFSKEEGKDRSPEAKRIASTRSVDLGPGSSSQKCVMDAERLKAPIRQHLEQESILDKESIAKDALENVFKNLNAYLNALDSSSDSSLKTCPAMHFKHTISGDAVSSEDDLHVDLYDDEEEICVSDSKLLLSAKELRLETVKHKIQKEPLVSDLKWSLLVAACHGYNFDKYLTPFPQHFLLNGRKDINALMQATEEVSSLSLMCNLSVNEISPSAIELLYWLLVELSSVKVVATSTREAESSMSTRPYAVFSVWQQPSSMLDRRLRSSGRGLTKVEAFCCARLDKFHALLHGGMVPSGVMRRSIDMALQLAKPGYGYGCSALGSKIKCVARCQVIVHPRVSINFLIYKTRVKICQPLKHLCCNTRN